MRHLRALMLGVALIALLAAGLGWLGLNELRATGGTSNEPVTIEVNQGSSTAEIAAQLRSAGLIRQPAVFVALVRWRNLDNKLQAGQHVLRANMTVSEILTALQSSTPIDEIQVTIPEGLRLEEIADHIAGAGIGDANTFLRVAQNGAAFRAAFPILSSLPQDASLEGYLFPDTYRFASTATVTDTIRTMLQEFSQKYTEATTGSPLTDRNTHEIVTMASIIQREAAQLKEMPSIAGVFWNRLSPDHTDETGGGRLQADPTIQYALGFSVAERTWWRKNLTATDLHIDSAYNTRERTGLPPGPIAAPGLDALRAAAQPKTQEGYLYFVASCAKDGTHKFARTLGEFQVFEAEYLACR